MFARAFCLFVFISRVDTNAPRGFPPRNFERVCVRDRRASVLVRAPRWFACVSAHPCDGVGLTNVRVVVCGVVSRKGEDAVD